MDDDGAIGCISVLILVGLIFLIAWGVISVDTSEEIPTEEIDFINRMKVSCDDDSCTYKVTIGDRVHSFPEGAFNQLEEGMQVKYTYDRGRLGGEHNRKVEIIPPPQLKVDAIPLKKEPIVNEPAKAN